MPPRARQVLADVDLIAAEDTRHTGRLLSHFGIKNRQIALHDHNEEAALDGIIVKLKSGDSVALVSDAGTPLVSDPGFRLLRAAHENNIPVSPVPGPCAFVAALSVAGLPTDKLSFEGFLPPKRAARKKRLQLLKDHPGTTVIYESVHRVSETIDDLCSVFGADRMAFVARELTKLHEQCVRAQLKTVAEMLNDQRIVLKGEFVIAVAGKAEEQRNVFEVDTNRLLGILAETLPGKQAVAIAARLSGQSRNSLYRQLLEHDARSDDEDQS